MGPRLASAGLITARDLRSSPAKSARAGEKKPRVAASELLKSELENARASASEQVSAVGAELACKERDGRS